MNITSIVNNLGIVVIGRNEGERLRRCLESVISHNHHIVYVDSASKDDSVAIANGFGIEVVQLDNSRSLNASRARSEGFKRLVNVYPKLEFVFFIDGDCELINQWIPRAMEKIETNSNVAVICGRRREKHPGISIYNRICDLEWDTPLGEVLSCGGDSIMRIRAYEQVGGFDPSIKAGEEPELCQRLRQAGWKILRIGVDMTWHDAAITTFLQWCRREMRTGYGALDVCQRFRVQNFVKLTNSARIWVFGWPLFMLFAGVTSFLFFGGDIAAKIVAASIGLFPLQITRLALKARRRGLSLQNSFAYGLLIMVSKWPQALGQIKKLWESNSNDQTSLVEYK